MNENESCSTENESCSTKNVLGLTLSQKFSLERYKTELEATTDINTLKVLVIDLIEQNYMLKNFLSEELKRGIVGE